VRESLAILFLACACGVAARSTPADRRAERSGVAELGGESSTGVADRSDPASFAAVEARGPSIAGGMHEVARRASRGERVELVRAERQDTCVRVAFEASAPVVAKLVDTAGQVLATTSTASTEGVLGETGPVCMRRGDAIGAVAEGSGVSVRWVAWASP
jgi:hypothetical protein